MNQWGNWVRPHFVHGRSYAGLCEVSLDFVGIVVDFHMDEIGLPVVLGPEAPKRRPPVGRRSGWCRMQAMQKTTTAGQRTLHSLTYGDLVKRLVGAVVGSDQGQIAERSKRLVLAQRSLRSQCRDRRFLQDFEFMDRPAGCVGAFPPRYRGARSLPGQSPPRRRRCRGCRRAIR